MANVVTEIGRRATELKILRLVSREEIPDGELSHLTALDNLTTLQIRHAAHFTWEKGVKQLPLSNLTSLDLAGSLSFSNNNNSSNADDAKTFALSLPTLTELDISFCLLNDECLFHITSIIKALTSLNFALCPITEVGLKHVADNALNLENLNLSGIKTFTSDGLSRLSSLSKLTKLNLNSCHDVDDDVLDALAAGVPGLEELRLKSCDDVQFKNLRQFPSLTFLDLSGMSNNNVEMTVQQLRTISLSFPNLKQLDLSASAIHDPLGHGLNFIASSFAGLESLSLRRCRRNGLGCITNVGVSALLTKLCRLKKLDISYCGDGITDEAFSRNMESVGRLGLLSISGCTKVSPQIINKIKSMCPRLHVEHDWFEPEKEPAPSQKCMLQ